MEGPCKIWLRALKILTMKASDPHKKCLPAQFLSKPTEIFEIEK